MSGSDREMEETEVMSDYTDAETGEAQVMPAITLKSRGPNKKKAGGFGKKGKVFASMDKMLQLVDSINDVQDKKVGVLVERDIELAKRLAQREASKKLRQEGKKSKIDKVKNEIKRGGRGDHRGDSEEKGEERRQKHSGKPAKSSRPGKPGRPGKAGSKGTDKTKKASFSKKGPSKKGGVTKKKVNFK